MLLSNELIIGCNNYLAIARGIEYKADWVGDPFIIRMLHAITVDHVSRLVAGQLLPEFVHRYVLMELVQHHQLLLSVDFYCKETRL